MEFLQYFKGKQLAWEGRPDYFLDGETLAATHCGWIRHRRCSGGLPMVGMGVMGNECGKDVRGKGEKI